MELVFQFTSKSRSNLEKRLWAFYRFQTKGHFENMRLKCFNLLKMQFYNSIFHAGKLEFVNIYWHQLLRSDQVSYVCCMAKLFGWKISLNLEKTKLIPKNITPNLLLLATIFIWAMTIVYSAFLSLVSRPKNSIFFLNKRGDSNFIMQVECFI